ncbi:MAG TPA: hypothetical protein VF618_22485 [Thermoanaerobaculia bacterium]
MSFDVPMRQTGWDALLRWALLVSGIADVLFGAAVLIAWKWFLALLRVPQPDNPAFVKLAAVLSIGAGLLFFVAGLAPWRYHANVTVAALVRFGSVALLLYLISKGLLPRHIYLLAGGEALLGMLHLIYSRRLAPAAAGPQ